MTRARARADGLAHATYNVGIAVFYQFSGLAYAGSKSFAATQPYAGQQEVSWYWGLVVASIPDADLQLAFTFTPSQERRSAAEVRRLVIKAKHLHGGILSMMNRRQSKIDRLFACI